MDSRQYEYIIVGGGPAGLQLAYYFEKMQLQYLILDSGHQPGSFFKFQPRHRKLISVNKIHTGSSDPEFNMRHDWNSLLTDDYSHLIKEYDTDFFPSADNLVKYLGDFSDKFNLKIQFDTKVVDVRGQEGEFALTDEAGTEYRAKRIIMATGLARDLKPDVPGIELADSYTTMSIDVKDYENKRVLIIGKGNSAFETADHIIGSAAMIHLCSPEPIVMAWKTHYVGHLRAVNNNVLDTYQLKSQNAILDAEIDSIQKDGDGYIVTFRYAHADGEVEAIAYDKVLCCAGFRIDDSMYEESCHPDLTIKDKYPKLTPEFESANQKGMYFAGTLTHSLDYGKTTSGFIHGFRYNCRALATILNYKYHSVDWEKEAIDANPQHLAERSLGRVNAAAGLWQQPGFMADFITMEDGAWHYQQELPLGYVQKYCAANGLQYFTVTLEYGDPIQGDPFHVSRIHRQNAEEAHRSQFLHPVVRWFDGETLLAEHHVVEDLEAIWGEEEHTKPLTAFFSNCLAGERSNLVEEAGRPVTKAGRMVG